MCLVPISRKPPSAHLINRFAEFVISVASLVRVVFVRNDLDNCDTDDFNSFSRGFNRKERAGCEWGGAEFIAVD